MTMICAVFILPLTVSAGEQSGVIGIVDTEKNLFLPADRYSAETAMADMAADSMRYALQTDIALINSGYIKSGIHQGEVDMEDIETVFSNDPVLCICLFSVQNLKLYLENGVSQVVVGSDEKIDTEASESYLFPQVSGFTFKYDPTAPAGERVYEIMIGGKAADLTDSDKKIITAVTDGALDGIIDETDAECFRTEKTLVDALAEYIADGKATAVDEGRIYARGLADNYITGNFPIRWVILIVGVIAIAIILIVKRSVIFNNYSEEYGKPRKY